MLSTCGPNFKTKGDALYLSQPVLSYNNAYTYIIGVSLLANSKSRTGYACIRGGGGELVLFSKSVLRQSNAEAANTFSRWMGTMYLFSLMGAFLSDSYLGRYLTCVSFQVLYLIVRVDSTIVGHTIVSTKTSRQWSPEPAFAAFGTDQFDEEDNTEKQSKISFYSYFYVALNMGSLVVETVLVYIQNLGNWILGFWICAACAALAFCLLLCGTFQYPPMVKGFMKLKGSKAKIMGYLDRASIITLVDVVKPANPWHLCTITQVEVKSIVTKREPKPPSELQRIGIGIAMAMASMIIAVIVEQQRLKHADSKNTRGLSIFWQIPQYVLVGVSEAFVYVAQMEFFATQTPDGLKSLGIGLSMSSSAMVSYICSIILTTVMAITSTNGEAGWVPPDLNDGHLDRYFFLLAALTAINLVLFVICAKR
ncbi:hypothetical protein Gorai_014918 [Gossypium raimondii]|uniref:Major facilitator superfamily (MFS) profile domain-containing protein n=1 Tax=Gossypium raimondii TaxID=29730 RepID=A0A7J8P4B4_GOSRA|nr:hypothetical protein [Gossypium raimondii]